MRRKDFVALTGLSEGTFKMLLARKQVPLGNRPTAPGWKDYTADDVLALEAASALARHGAKKSDAREWVDQYSDVAIERASLRPKRARRDMYLGAAAVVGIADGDIEFDHFHPVVGIMAEVSEEIERLETAIGPRFRVDNVMICNLNMCVKLIAHRAAEAGIQDARLEKLKGWFQ